MMPPEHESGLYVYRVKVPTLDPETTLSTEIFNYHAESYHHALEQYNDDPMVDPREVDRGRQMEIFGPFIEVRNARSGGTCFVEPQNRHISYMDPSYERYWSM
jgi:hypothetical protein